MPDVQVREITGTKYVPLTFRLRYEVWSEVMHVKPEFRAQRLINDEHDEHAQHWAAFDGDNVVASARMCIHEKQHDTPDAFIFCQTHLPAPVATINRLVVHRKWRGRGISQQFDACRIQAARNGNARCLLASASGTRIASLQRSGFKLTEYSGTSPYVLTSPSFCTTASERVYITTSSGNANGGSQGAVGDRRAAICGANAAGAGGL
jgi:predicted GNAT family N-acyltransferase